MNHTNDTVKECQHTWRRHQLALLAILILQICLFACLARSGRAQTDPPEPVKEETTLRHDYATVNGIKLHYVTQGTGPVLIFLHGFPEFWYMWRGQIAEFAKNHRVIALDMPGYNLSDKPRKVSDYAMMNLVANLYGFIDTAAHGQKVTLIGHDWGGGVIWPYAAFYPDTLERVVIMNAPHPELFLRELKTNPFQLQASSMMFLAQDKRAEETLRKNDFALLSRYLFDSCTRRTDYTEENRKAYREAWSQSGALTAMLQYYRAAQISQPISGKVQAVQPTVSLPVIKVPTLVLWGDRDPGLMIGNLTGLEKRVTFLTVKRFPTGGHWLVHDEPDAVNQAIREFITPVSPPQTAPPTTAPAATP